MLNAGVNPSTNTTVIPRAAFDAVTTAHAVSVGKSPSPDESIEGYGMGWFRQSYLGREVRAFKIYAAITVNIGSGAPKGDFT